MLSLAPCGPPWLAAFEDRCREQREGGRPDDRAGDPLAASLDALADCRNLVLEAERRGQLSPVSAELIRGLVERAAEIVTTHGGRRR